MAYSPPSFVIINNEFCRSRAILLTLVADEEEQEEEGHATSPVRPPLPSRAQLESLPVDGAPQLTSNDAAILSNGQETQVEAAADCMGGVAEKDDNAYEAQSPAVEAGEDAGAEITLPANPSSATGATAVGIAIVAAPEMAAAAAVEEAGPSTAAAVAGPSATAAVTRAGRQPKYVWTSG